MVHDGAPAVREFGGIRKKQYIEIFDNCSSGSESLPPSLLQAHIKTQSNYLLSISKSKYSVKGGLLLTGGRYLMIREEAEDILKAFHSRYGHRFPSGRIKHVLSATVTYDLFGNGCSTGSIQRDYEYICSMCPKCNQNAAVPVEKGPNKQAKTRIRVRVVATGGSPMFNLELEELTPKPNDEIVVKEVVSKPKVIMEPSTNSSRVPRRSQEPESALRKKIQKPRLPGVYLEPSFVSSRLPRDQRSRETESTIRERMQKPRLLGVYLEPSFVSSRGLQRAPDSDSTLHERRQGVYLELSTNRAKVLRRVGRREAPESTPRGECDVAYKDDTMELQPAETVPIPNLPLPDFDSVELATNRSEVDSGKGGGAQGENTGTDSDSVSPIVVSSQRRVRVKMDSRKENGLKMKRKHKDTINTGDIPSTTTNEVIKKKSSVKDEVPDPEREEENDGGQIMNPEVNLETSTASPTVLRRSPEPETTLRKCDVARKDRTNENEPTETVQSLLDFIFGKFTTTRTEVKADKDEGGSAQGETTGVPSTAPLVTNTMLADKEREKRGGENESHCGDDDGEGVTAKKKRPSEENEVVNCERLEAKVEVKREVVDEEEQVVGRRDIRNQVRDIAGGDSDANAEVQPLPIQYPAVDSADVHQSNPVQYPDVVNTEVPSLPVQHPEAQEVEDPVGRAVLAYVAQMNQPPVPFRGLVAPTAPKTVLLPTPTSGRFPYRPPIYYKYGHYWPPE